MVVAFIVSVVIALISFLFTYSPKKGGAYARIADSTAYLGTFDEKLINKRIDELEKQNEEIEKILNYHDNSFDLKTIERNELGTVLSDMYVLAGTHYISNSLRSDIIRSSINSITHDDDIFNNIKDKPKLILDENFYDRRVVEGIRNGSITKASLVRNNHNVINYDYMVTMDNTDKKMFEICKMITDFKPKTVTKQALMLLYSIMPFEAMKVNPCPADYIQKLINDETMLFRGTAENIISSYNELKDHIKDFTLKDMGNVNINIVDRACHVEGAAPKKKTANKTVVKRERKSPISEKDARKYVMDMDKKGNFRTRKIKDEFETLYYSDDDTGRAMIDEAIKKAKEDIANEKLASETPKEDNKPSIGNDGVKTFVIKPKPKIEQAPEQTLNSVDVRILAEKKKAEAKAKVEAEAKAKVEAESEAKAKVEAEAEAKAKVEAEAKTKVEAEDGSEDIDFGQDEGDGAVKESFLKIKFNDSIWNHIKIEVPKESKRIYHLAGIKLYSRVGEPMPMGNALATYTNGVIKSNDFNTFRNSVHRIFTAMNNHALRLILQYIRNSEALADFKSIDINCVNLYMPVIKELKAKIAELEKVKTDVLNKQALENEKNKTINLIINLESNKKELDSQSEEERKKLIDGIAEMQQLQKDLRYRLAIANAKKNNDEDALMGLRINILKQSAKIAEADKRAHQALADKNEEMKWNAEKDKEIANLKQSIDKLVNDRKALRKQMEENADINQEDYNAMIEEKDEFIRSLNEDFDIGMVDYKKLEKKMNKIIAEKKQKEEEASALKSELEKCNKLSKELKKELELDLIDLREANSKNAELIKEIESQKELIKSLDMKIESAESNIKGSHVVKNMLISSKSSLSYVISQIDKLKLKVQEVEKKNSTKRASLVRKEIGRLEKFMTSIDMISKEIDSLKNKTIKHGEEKKSATSEIKSLQKKNQYLKSAMGNFLKVNGTGFEYLRSHIDIIEKGKQKIIEEMEMYPDKADTNQRVSQMMQLQAFNNELYHQSKILARYNKYAESVFDNLKKVDFEIPEQSPELISEYRFLLDHYKQYGKEFKQSKEMQKILREKNTALEESLTEARSSIAALKSNSKEGLEARVADLTKKLSDLAKSADVVNYKELEDNIRQLESERESLKVEYGKMIEAHEKEKMEWVEKINETVDNYGKDLSREVDEMIRVLDLKSTIDFGTNNVSYPEFVKKQLYVLSNLKVMKKELDDLREKKELSDAEIGTLSKKLSESEERIKDQDAIIQELKQMAGQIVGTLNPVKTATEELREQKNELEVIKKQNEAEIEKLKQEIQSASKDSPKQITNMLNLILFSVSNDHKLVELDNILNLLSPFSVRMAYIAYIVDEMDANKHVDNMHWKSKLLNFVKMVGKGETIAEKIIENLDKEQTDSIESSDTLSRMVEAYIVSYYKGYRETEEYKKLLPMIEKYKMEELFPDEIMDQVKWAKSKQLPEVASANGSNMAYPFIELAYDILRGDRWTKSSLVNTALTPSDDKHSEIYEIILLRAYTNARRAMMTREATKEINAIVSDSGSQLREMTSALTSAINGQSFFIKKLQSLLGSSGSPQDLIKALEDKLASMTNADVLIEILDKYKNSMGILDSEVRKSMRSIDDSISKIKAMKDLEKNKESKIAELTERIRELEVMASGSSAIKDELEKAWAEVRTGETIKAELSARIDDLMKKDMDQAMLREDLSSKIAQLEEEKKSILKTNEEIISEISKVTESIKTYEYLEGTSAENVTVLETLKKVRDNLLTQLHNRVAKKDGVDLEINSILKALDSEKNGIQSDIEQLKKQVSEIVDLTADNLSRDSDILAEEVSQKIAVAIDTISDPSVKFISDLLSNLTGRWKENKISLAKYLEINKTLENKLLEQTQELTSANAKIEELKLSQEKLDAYKLAYSIMSNDQTILDKINEDVVEQKKSFAADISNKLKIAAEDIPNISKNIQELANTSKNIIEKTKAEIESKQKEVDELRSIIDEKMKENSDVLALSNSMSESGVLTASTISKLNDKFKQHRIDLANLNLTTGDLLQSAKSMKLELDELRRLKPINQKQKDELALAIADAKAVKLLEESKTIENITSSIRVIRDANKIASNLAYMLGNMPGRLLSRTRIGKLSFNIKDSLDSKLQSLLLGYVRDSKERAELIDIIKSITSENRQTVYDEIYYPVYVEKK